jgi:hypothetical protein
MSSFVNKINLGNRMKIRNMQHIFLVDVRLTSGRRPVVKIIAESLSQHDENHVVPTPLSGIRVVGRRRCYIHNKPSS